MPYLLECANQQPMRNEPRNNDSWKESKPHNNDVSNVKMIVVVISFSYHLPYNPEILKDSKGLVCGPLLGQKIKQV